MMSKALLERLHHDPVLQQLKKRHYELYEEPIPYNWDEYDGYEDYLDKIRKKIAVKEQELSRRNPS